MKKTLLLLFIIILMITPCKAIYVTPLYVCENDSTILYGNIIQSAIIDSFVRAIEFDSKKREHNDAIYVLDDDCVLSENSYNVISSLIDRKLIPISLLGPSLANSDILKKRITVWEIQLKLSRNVIIVRLIPLGVSRGKIRNKNVIKRIFVSWFYGTYNYNCKTHQWKLKNFEYGAI